ncbi:MAG: aldo/keto reductase [Segniliparus sp.]|uniref:aldo/keto reductase n=1 Tax=Segniliparus sp. TaxID=2804064 RepID=UPI003F3DDE60
MKLLKEYQPAPTVELHDGTTIPQVGLGVAKMPNEDTYEVVRDAIQLGYRHIDTASKYGNERGVGQGIAQSGVDRADIFVTTKLWFEDFDDVAGSLRRSLDELQTDYVDLFLIHWPVPQLGKYVEAWKGLVEAKESGLARSVGVSNFESDHLQDIIGATGVAPAVNQVELHPYFQQSQLKEANAQHGVTTQAWSPLAQGIGLLDNPHLSEIAEKHGKTIAQVILRWHTQLGHVVIPKTSSSRRLAENFDIFDFVLDATDLQAFEALDDPESGRLGCHPNDGYSAHVSPKSKQRVAELENQKAA